MIDAHEQRDGMSADVPNSSIQNDMINGNKRVITDIKGVMVYLLV